MDLPLLTNFRVTRDPRNVVTGIVNVPGRTHNVFNEEALSELGMLVDGLYKDPTIRLVLFRSGKQAGFHAGGDLRWVYAIESRDAVDRLAVAGQELFDRIERLPMPTVAVIHGPCLGGGLEFASPAAIGWPGTTSVRGSACRKYRWACSLAGEVHSVCRNWWVCRPRWT